MEILESYEPKVEKIKVKSLSLKGKICQIFLDSISVNFVQFILLMVIKQVRSILTNNSGF